MKVIVSSSELKVPFNKKVFVLCDDNTAQHCLPYLKGEFTSVVIPAGEQSKTLDTCTKVWDDLIEAGADRNSELWCLGGGMICDLGGYAASSFLRGISFTLIPTSLLAMVDAANGGKSGVDYRGLKNYIGAFTIPTDVLLFTDFLKTLPEKEWINGKVEMLKHGLISDAEHFSYLKGTGPRDVSMIKAEAISRSVEIKEKHCNSDRLEKGIRKRLNFGHTIGHAIESLSLLNNRSIPHGLAVGIGMIAETSISHTDWSLSKQERDDIQHYLRPLMDELDIALLDTDKLLPLIMKDKKNVDGKAYFSLLSSIGNSQENILVGMDSIIEAIEVLRSLK